jgi:hypothetical protein
VLLVANLLVNPLDSQQLNLQANPLMYLL